MAVSYTHLGKLILESQKGEGTCITFTLKNNLMDAIAEEKMLSLIHI